MTADVYIPLLEVVNVALNEVYELTLKTELQGQECTNVFFYREVASFPAGLTNPAEALASSFFLRVLPDIRAVMSDDTRFNEIVCRSLWRETIKHTILLTGFGGDVNVETLPPFVAMSLRLVGSNPAVRDGFKRFAGIPESYQVDGLLNLVGTILTRVNALRDEMSARLRDTATGLIDWGEPVLVKRVRAGAPGAYTYRLPINEAETVVSVITGSTADLVVSSQTSRKVGRGS